MVNRGNTPKEGVVSKNDVLVEFLEVSRLKERVEESLNMQIEELLALDEEEVEELLPGIGLERFREMFVDIVDVDEMATLIMKPYEDAFTEEELRALVEFHKTPAGQKFVEKGNMIAHQTLLLLRPYVDERITERLSELGY